MCVTGRYFCTHERPCLIRVDMAELRKPSVAESKIEVINDTAGTHIDAIAEKKLLRKCDLHVLPPLFVLFLLAFLDSKYFVLPPESH